MKIFNIFGKNKKHFSGVLEPMLLFENRGPRVSELRCRLENELFLYQINAFIQYV
jgi:hypothetical protein